MLQGPSKIQVPPTAAKTIVLLEKEKDTLFGRLLVEVSAMAKIVKKTRTEGCKDLFAKMSETIKSLNKKQNHFQEDQVS